MFPGLTGCSRGRYLLWQTVIIFHSVLIEEVKVRSLTEYWAQVQFLKTKAIGIVVCAIILGHTLSCLGYVGRAAEEKKKKKSKTYYHTIRKFPR